MIVGLIALLAGLIAGALAFHWAVRMTPHVSSPGQTVWHTVTAIATGLLSGGLAYAMLERNCQQTPLVRPDEFWRYGRVVFHLLLLWLLVAAVVTDYRDYVIPDQITLLGLCIGLGLATLSGDLQMMHLWVDWNTEVPGYQAAWFPEWFATHRHWHGLAWSAAGAVSGVVMTSAVRFTSRLVLGQEAMGFGDVTLMAMIGSFLGWQPTLCACVLAPLCGVVIAILTRILTGRTFVAYGPFLAAGAVTALFTWGRIWTVVRKPFGDAVLLAIVFASALGALVLLLALIRIYRALPVQRPDREAPADEP